MNLSSVQCRAVQGSAAQYRAVKGSAEQCREVQSKSGSQELVISGMSAMRIVSPTYWQSEE